jgi:hypothetical protein
MQFSPTNENIDFEGSIPANHSIKKGLCRSKNINHLFYWCPGPELNRHGAKHRGILSPLRLPIPPPGRADCWIPEFGKFFKEKRLLGSEFRVQRFKGSALYMADALDRYLILVAGDL